MNNKKLSEQELSEKIEIRIKVGYITCIVSFIIYLAYNIYRVFNPGFPDIENSIIVFFLLIFALNFLDYYGLLVNLVKLNNNKNI